MSMTPAFPFRIDPRGGIDAVDDHDSLRGRIIQVLFTAPGERVHQPTFGCGLLNLAFDPNNEVLAAATEFTVGQALARWLADEIIVDGVSVSPDGEMVLVEVAYTRKADRQRQAVRIQFK